MNKRSFTIIELFIVLTIMSVVAVFGYMKYTSMMAALFEKDAVTQLTELYSAATIIRIKTGKYPLGNTADINVINGLLGSSLKENNFIYAYQCVWGLPDYFVAVAAWKNEPTKLFAVIRSGPISDTNPCCASGATCPTLKSCS